MKLNLADISFNFTPAEAEALLAQARVCGCDLGSKRTRIRDLLEAELVSIIAEYTTCRRCRECGCTDRHGCPDGCQWVEEDLCSACVEGEE